MSTRSSPSKINGRRDGVDAQARTGDAFVRRWIKAGPGLSPARRRLVENILDHLDVAVFLSSPELAMRFGTDPATVVRTVQALGYTGFAEFSRELRAHFIANVNPYRVMAAGAGDHKGAAFHIARSVQRDSQNIQRLHDTLDPAELAAIGKRLLACRRVLVVAGDLEHPLAEFLAYSLSGLDISATAPAGEGLTLLRQRTLTARDGVIGIAFRRCLRVPVEAVRVGRETGAFTLAISDEVSTPIARAAEKIVIASIEGESYASSYVAPMSAINALLVACAHADPKRSLSLLKPTEEEYVHGHRWYQER